MLPMGAPVAAMRASRTSAVKMMSAAETAASPASTTSDTLVPREVLFGNPEYASPAISPDGRMLAYLRPDDGVLNVWCRSVGGQDDRVVTSDCYRGIRQFFWAEDSQTLTCRMMVATRTFTCSRSMPSRRTWQLVT